MTHLFTSPEARLATAFAGGSNAGSNLNHAISQFVRDSSVFLHQPHQQQWPAITALIAVSVLLTLHAVFTRTTDQGGYCSRAAPTAVTALIVAAMAYIAEVHFGSYKYFINTNDPDSIRLVAVGVLLLQLVVRVLLDYRRTHAHGGGGFLGGPVLLFGSAFERFESSGDNVHHHGQRLRRWRRRRVGSGNSNHSSNRAPSLGKERKRPRLDTYPASLPAGGGADTCRNRRGGGASLQDPPPPFDVSCNADVLTLSIPSPLNEERDRGSGGRPTAQKDIIRGVGDVADTQDAVHGSVPQGGLLANSEPPLSAERRKWRQRVLWGEGGGGRGSGGDYYRTWADASRKKQSFGKSGSGQGSNPPSGGTEGAGAEEYSLAAAALTPSPTGQTGRWIFVLPAWCRNLLGTGNHTGANLTPPPPPTDSPPRSSTTCLLSPSPLGKSSGGPGHPKAGSGDSVMAGSSPEGNENRDGKRKRVENGNGEGSKRNMAPSRSPRSTLLVTVPPTRQEIDMPMLTGTGTGAGPGVRRAPKAKRRRCKETQEDAGEGDDECSD